ncbi:hypothetical protein [Microcoleus sp. AT3-D2]|uniref:hypothetical protein n=1 Tax=Microcoleus sp. AT3-D2 TaxID=2818612 RepID=UPI002FD3E626
MVKEGWGIGKKPKILPNVRRAAEFGVGKIQKIVNPLATASAFAGKSAFSDKTQPLEVEIAGPVFHNAGILVS